MTSVRRRNSCPTRSIVMRKITSNADINSGSPGIEGTRLTCANVATSLWYGFDHSIEAYLRTYDYLSADDILRCLKYCSRQQCVEDSVHSYCEQCTLDRRPSDPELAREYDACNANEDVDDRENIWTISGKLLKEYEG